MVACRGMSDFTAPKPVLSPVASVEVTPAQLTVTEGSTAPLQVVVRDEDNDILTDRTLIWSSNDTSVAQVSVSGLVTARKSGVARIAVSADGRSAVVPVTVAARPVASVRLTLTTPSMQVGEYRALTVQTLDDRGVALPNRPVFWESSDQTVAIVFADGTVQGLAPGVATISATSEGRSASVGVTVSPVRVARIDVTPSIDSLVVGQSTQFTAIARDSTGAPLIGRTMVWRTSISTIATVSSSGLVLAANPGTITLTATSDGVDGTATLVVLARPVGAVIVSPSQSSLNVGQTLRLTVQVTDANGTLLVGRPVSFSSSNDAVARVASDGTVTATGAGSATITVVSEGKVGSAVVIVAPSPVASVRVSPASITVGVGQSLPLVATALDAGGAVLGQRPVTWFSGAPAQFTIAADGAVTGLAPGSALAFASIEGKLGNATVNVRGANAASVSITPNTGTVFVNASRDLVATVRDSAGALLAGRLVQWRSSDNTILVVSNTGRVRAIAPGNATITAIVESVSGTASFVVAPVPVAAVVVGAPSSMLPGQTAQASVSVLGAGGEILTGRTVVWTSSTPTVATVSSSGLITAVGLGTTLLRAECEGVSGALSIIVTPIPVASVAVSLGSSALLVGATTQATAVTRDSLSNVLSGRVITWSSSNSAVASVNGAGLVTAVAPGSATISATSEGKSGSAGVAVSLVPVNSVQLTLGTSTLVVGGGTQGTVVLRDAANNVLSGRVITWSSSDAAVASVNSSGAVTAVAPGTATITATSEGKSGSAGVTVTVAPVNSVQLTLGANTLVVGGTTSGTVVLRDAANNVLTGRVITWSSSNALVAGVSASGVITALAPGSATITATSEGKSGSAGVTVSLVPVNSVQLTLGSSTLTVGGTTSASVVLRDAANNVLTGRVIAYSSSDNGVATVDGSGTVTAVAPGTATITATSEGKSGSAGVAVSLAPVNSVQLTLGASSLLVGATTQGTVVLRDAANNVLTGRVITYSSSDNSVATVSGTGVVTAIAAGSATITATSEGKSGSAGITVSLVPVNSVQLTLGSASIVVGGTTSGTVVLRDAANNVLTGRVITYSSSDNSIATVNGSGVVTGIAPGTATITATSEGKSGSAFITVAPAPVNSVQLTLGSGTLAPGATTQGTVILRDAANNVLTGRVVTWSSSDNTIATVDAAGLVTAVSAGSATITATSEGKSGNAGVTVTLVPVNSVQLTLGSNTLVVGGTTSGTVVLRDAANNVLTGRVVTWSTSDANVATVSNTGVVTAIGAGSATITATSEGKSDNASVTVTLAPVNTVQLTLGSSTLVIGAATQGAVVLRDASNNVLTGRVVTWSTSDGAVATVDANGLVTAVAAGSATITATSEGKSGSAGVTVTLAPVNTVQLTLGNNTLTVGGTTSGTVVLRDASNNVLTGRVVTWSTSDANVATVDNAGVVTAIGAGSATITATSEGKSGSAGVTVTPVPVNSVQLTLGSNALVVGGTTTGTVVLRDAANNVLTGRVVTWSTSDANVATVSNTGVVTAIGAGSATITATSEGKSDNASVTVTLAPVATVQLSLGSSTLVIGATTQGTVVLRDASNNVLTGRVVTWSTSDANVATVDNAGVVTAIAVGSATINATSEGQTGSAGVSVIVPPVNSVSVTLGSSTLAIAATTQATVVLRDAANNVLTGRVVTWSTSDANVATVDNTGLVTAIAAGSATITATSETKTGSAGVTVLPVPVNTVQLTLGSNAIVVGATTQGTVVLRDAANNVLTGRVVTWSTSDANVATVDAAGVVTGTGAGSATITATSEGKSGTAGVTVTLAPVNTVQLTLGSNAIVIGATTQGTVVLRDAANLVLTGRAITWSTSDGAVATVDANGLVTAVGVGSATITATSEGKSGTAGVTVSLAPVATVQITLGTGTLRVGDVTQATVVLRDANNNVLTGRVISFGSSKPTSATVDAAGVVTATGPGNVTITATSEGKTGSVSIVVSP
jgi:uncharacterized protein YjdB